MALTLETRPRAGGREALAFAVFTVWILSGLVLDGWSHNVDKPETFFTPWHALLYSGFLASTAFGAMDSARLRRSGEVPQLVDRWSRLGVVSFAMGMGGDFAWHQVFGIEEGIDALLSPTHLLLMTGGLLLVTTPLRVAAPGPVSVVIAGAGTSVLAGFFTMYLSAFRGDVAGSATSSAGRSGVAEMHVIAGIASVLLTTTIIVIPLLIVVRTVRTQPGAITAMLTLTGVALSALDGFDRPALILAAVAGGVAADIALVLGRPLLVGILVPLAMWPVWFAALHLTGEMVWNAELWSGTCFLAVVLGAALTALAGVSGSWPVFGASSHKGQAAADTSPGRP